MIGTNADISRSLARAGQVSHVGPIPSGYRFLGYANERFLKNHSYRVDVPKSTDHVRFTTEITAARTAMEYRTGMTDEETGRVYDRMECVRLV